MLIQFALNDERRLTFAGVHLDHTVRQVAIFYGWYACHYLDTLNVRCAECTGRGTHRLAVGGIVVQSHAVNFNGSAKRGITFLLNVAAQGDAVVAHQGGVGSLTARQQHGDIADVEYLLIVQRLAVYSIRGGGLVRLTLGHHRHLVEFQVALLQLQCQVVDVALHRDGQRPLLIAQTLHHQRVLPFRHML